MAIPTTGPISWSALQTEFGGANPIRASEYRRGYYIPDLTSNTAVPGTNTNLNASKWRGAVKQTTYLSGSLPEVDLNNGSASSYFFDPALGEGGGLQGGGWYTAYSNAKSTITTPTTSYPLKLTVYSYTVALGNGYRYESDLYGTDYYYDHVRIPGIRVFDQNGTVVGSADSTDTTDYWYGAYTYQVSVGCPSLTMIVSPNTTYTIRYKVDWIMGGGGYNVFRRPSGGPYYSVYNY